MPCHAGTRLPVRLTIGALSRRVVPEMASPIGASTHPEVARRGRPETRGPSGLARLGPRRQRCRIRSIGPLLSIRPADSPGFLCSRPLEPFCRPGGFSRPLAPCAPLDRASPPCMQLGSAAGIGPSAFMRLGFHAVNRSGSIISAPCKSPPSCRHGRGSVTAHVTRSNARPNECQPIQGRRGCPLALRDFPVRDAVDSRHRYPVRRPLCQGRAHDSSRR